MAGALEVLAPRGLSKLPLGLLGFFGVKNGGDYPQEIGSVIVPTLALEGLLAINYAEKLAVSCVAPAGAAIVAGVVVATGLPAVVPANENWFVASVSAAAFTGVGDSWTGSGMRQSRQTGAASNWHHVITPEITNAASQNRMLPGAYPDGFWAGPGDSFVWNYSASVNASATAQASMQLSIVRFPI